ncbi:discoidin domain-containing protein [Solitalea sp. MAHUQ-68]|uniref:Discoidin domain-containing protein n=1 Tax=Solitalea agri TaxID=2953739 RepID=A0A9X2JC53_9SPHI|nr:glycoside hydrolase family 2 TIM barrel-domain containing protein [Solitalea agri]MCO4292703.1 discoidin domain-containing protein [Solitalea agri]
MKGSFKLFAFILVVLNSSIAWGQKIPAPRIDLNFNTKWAFFRGEAQGAEAIHYDDKTWSAVTIPHTIRLETKHNGGNRNYHGIAWYRRYFKIEKSAQGKRITLNFEGVQKNCEVFLNGKKIKEHFGGYLGFVVDITDKVKFEGSNVLALRISNLDDPFTPPGKAEAKMDFNYYGGIYRNVTLVVTNKLFISDPLEADKIAGGGLFISFPNVDKKKATVSIKTHLVNQNAEAANLTLITSIKDKNGREVAVEKSNSALPGNEDKELVQNLTVVNPSLWHPDHPYLYQLESKVYNGKELKDVKITSIGIRTISFKSPSGKADGFYINGEKLYLRGANRHQSYQHIGDAAPNSMQLRDALQIKKGGFNAVRAAHYPQSPAFLDACDKIGLLVIECEPGWQFFSKDSLFVSRSYRQIREMIRRDRNRPSVFLWETSLNESPTPEFWAREAVRIAHEEMPNDQLFTADDFFAKGRKCYDVCYKVVNEDGTDPMPDMPSLTREWGDTWMADPQKENGLRASRMYSPKGLINQCILRQNALNGTPLEEEGGYWDHARLDANDRISGYFLWSFNDFPRGTEETTAFCGVVDIDRYEKFGYYQLQAMQDARNPVYGPMVFIASYNNRPDLDSSLMVFSNCDKVKLYRNNKLIGEQTRAENAKTAQFVASKGGCPYFRFNTSKYEAGELKAEGFLDGKIVCSHTVKTPGKAHHLEIEIADKGIQPIADGSDMIPVYVKVCDKEGTVVSNTEQLQSYKLNLTASGNGTLIGANIPRVGVAEQQSEGGIGYGIIRTTEQAGEIVVTASSPGLISATATIKTVPYHGKYVQDGAHKPWRYEEEESETAAPVKVNNGASMPPAITLSSQMLGVNGNDKAPELDKLVDGNARSIWRPQSDKLPIELKIDLGKSFTLKGSKIIWGKDSDWYTYSIQGSADGKNWNDLVSERKVSGQDYKPVIYDEAQVRYLKVKLSEVQPEKSKVAIGDIELYGVSAF